jgi:hypothetical protein
MAAGGFCKLPDGTVVVAMNLPSPAADGPARVRVLVRARNRARALTRLRNLGLRSVYLRGNTAPPTPDEITAVLHHPDGLVWRTAPDAVTAAPRAAAGLDLPPEMWQPIRSLLRRPALQAHPRLQPQAAPAPQLPVPPQPQPKDRPAVGRV